MPLFYIVVEDAKATQAAAEHSHVKESLELYQAIRKTHGATTLPRKILQGDYLGQVTHQQIRPQPHASMRTQAGMEGLAHTRNVQAGEKPAGTQSSTAKGMQPRGSSSRSKPGHKSQPRTTQTSWHSTLQSWQYSLRCYRKHYAAYWRTSRKNTGVKTMLV